MSDRPEITPEIIEAAKAADTRMRKIAMMIDVQTDLRDSRTLKMLFEAARADADDAIDDLAELSPADTVKVSAALVKIRTLVYIRQTLRSIVLQGQQAEQAMRGEEEANREYEQ